MQQVKLSSLFIDKHHPVFEKDYRHIVLVGGRASGKTTTPSNKIVYGRFIKPYSSAIVIRKHQNKIGRSVFNEIQKSCRRLRLTEKTHFKKKQSPFQFEFLPQKNKIYFAGLEDRDDIKGMVDPSFPIKEVWIEELTEFFKKSLREGEQQINNIIATFIRSGEEEIYQEQNEDELDESEFVVYYSFNPPENPNAPIMQWLNKVRKRDDFLIIFTTYEDLPKNWLGEAFIKEAEALKRSDPLLYQNIYLGECVGVQGRIYTIKDKYIIKQHEERDHYDFFVMGIDVGESKSATTFVLTGYYRENNLLKAHVLREYYHRNSNEKEFDTKEFDEYADEFIRFYVKCVNEFKKRPNKIMVDHDIMFLKALKRKFNETRIDFQVVKKARKFEINTRIKAIKLMLGYDQLHFSEKVPITIRAFREAMWNEKKSDAGIDERLDDLTTNIDSIDCTEYSLERHFGDMIKFSKGSG